MGIIDECSEHSYMDRFCRIGRHLEKGYVDHEYEYNEEDDKMGLGGEGRRLRKGGDDSSKYGNYELDDAERDDCTEEDGCEEHRRLVTGSRRLGRAESGNYELEEAERDDCTEEDGCEHEESEDEGERRLAGGSVEVERDGEGRNLGGCEDSGEEDGNEREEHENDAVYDDGAKRLLRAAIQN